MILKYYCNGWNYIDNVKDVKWINIDLIDAYTKGLSEHQFKFEDTDRVIGYGKHQETGEWIEWDDPTVVLNNLIHNRLNHVMREKDELKFGAWIFTKIEYSAIKELLFMVNNPDSPCKNNFNYARMLFYTEDGQRQGILFLNTGYLLNDQGQTVEKIG